MSEISPLERRRAPTDDRRAAIARAARELIVEKGVEGLRTRDIADRVGINVATLHYHVPSKEALIELVADSLRQEFMSQHATRPRAQLGVEERMDLGVGSLMVHDQDATRAGALVDTLATHFGPKRVREIIEQVHKMKMPDAMNVFDKEWEAWRGATKQTDDVLLIGIKFQP